MNTNWARWITASITKHFDSYKGDLSFYTVETPKAVEDPEERVELRVNGPNFSEPSKNYWMGWIDVQLLLLIQPDDLDAYKSSRFIGQLLTAFTAIQVMKYGSAAVDDDTYVGTLYLNPGLRPKVSVACFGQISPSAKLNYTILNAEYFVDIVTT